MDIGTSIADRERNEIDGFVNKDRNQHTTASFVDWKCHNNGPASAQIHEDTEGRTILR